MNPSQAAEVLAVAAAFDRRTVSPEDARAWALALDGLDPKACAEAVVEHYRTETTWVMPAHVRKLIDSPEAARRRRHAWESEMRERYHVAAIFSDDTEESIAARSRLEVES